ncbi:PHP domain-containing protein [bacterium]|nr:PHP domain-containing protein [bacterium]
MSFIDLHSHTTASDGTYTPAELVLHAKKQNLSALAITDHDTLGGLPEALIQGEKSGVEVVNGVEISTAWKNSSLHILGYLFDPNHPSLLTTLDWMVEQRQVRNQKLVENLQNLGIKITYEMVRDEAGEDIVARPHFAKVLLALGVVDTLDQAFDDYLSHQGKAYVHKVRMTPEKAIKAIRDAGGVPVLAHPQQYINEGEDLHEILETIVPLGLEGIEVWYPSHSEEMTQQFLFHARLHKLISTGGSDFHGANKPDIQLGTGYGDLRVEESVLHELKERAGLL